VSFSPASLPDLGAAARFVPDQCRSFDRQIGSPPDPSGRALAWANETRRWQPYGTSAGSCPARFRRGAFSRTTTSRTQSTLLPASAASELGRGRKARCRLTSNRAPAAGPDCRTSHGGGSHGDQILVLGACAYHAAPATAREPRSSTRQPVHV